MRRNFVALSAAATLFVVPVPVPVRALTPLSAQTLGGRFALPGITGIMMGVDGRPSAIRITLHSQAIGLALILPAAALTEAASTPTTR